VRPYVYPFFAIISGIVAIIFNNSDLLPETTLNVKSVLYTICGPKIDRFASLQALPYKEGSREAIIIANIVFPKDIAIKPARARGVFLTDQMITSAVLNGRGRLPLS
jgi:hypothetical protein